MHRRRRMPRREFIRLVHPALQRSLVVFSTALSSSSNTLATRRLRIHSPPPVCPPRRISTTSGPITIIREREGAADHVLLSRVHANFVFVCASARVWPGACASTRTCLVVCASVHVSVLASAHAITRSPLHQRGRRRWLSREPRNTTSSSASMQWSKYPQRALVGFSGDTRLWTPSRARRSCILRESVSAGTLRAHAVVRVYRGRELSLVRLGRSQRVRSGALRAHGEVGARVVNMSRWKPPRAGRSGGSRIWAFVLSRVRACPSGPTAARAYWRIRWRDASEPPCWPSRIRAGIHVCDW